MKINKIQQNILPHNFSSDKNKSAQSKTPDKYATETISDIALLGLLDTAFFEPPKNILKPKTKSEYISAIGIVILIAASLTSLAKRFYDNENQSQQIDNDKTSEKINNYPKTKNKKNIAGILSDIALLGLGISYLSGNPKNFFKPNTKSEYISVIAIVTGACAAIASPIIRYKDYLDSKKQNTN